MGKSIPIILIVLILVIIGALLIGFFVSYQEDSEAVKRKGTISIYPIIFNESEGKGCFGECEYVYVAGNLEEDYFGVPDNDRESDCDKDSDCDDDYYSDNYCKGDDVHYKFHDFSCVDNKCEEEISEELAEECDYSCSDGECISGICNSDSDCLERDFCEFEDCSKTIGVCVEVPQICFTLYDPVCGCDGVTYSNDCVRRMSKISKDYDGECVGECSTDEDCDDDYYSDKYCVGDDVYKEFHDFSCVGASCVEDISEILVEECDYGCLSGNCIKESECYENSDCDDNDLYTYDECVINVSGNYCKYTPIKCVVNNDCGITGFIGEVYCLEGNVHKDFSQSVCLNPESVESSCEVTITPKIVFNCGTDYCEDFGENYCKNGDVYRGRICHDKGCSDGGCISTLVFEEEKVEDCSSGCSNGDCL
jgi:hypothetical protein